MLSERERQLWADIEADLQAGDPDFASRLAPTQVSRRRGVLGSSLIAVGLALVLATLAVAFPLAILGLAVTGAGAALVAQDVAARLEERARAGGLREP